LIALGAGFHPLLTGRENIFVNASVLGLSVTETKARLEEIIEFAGVREFIDSPIHNYSSGMQVRLGFAIAAACRPDILLLDEVLAVGDMAFQAKCFNTLSRFRSEGTGFILVSHNLHQIARYADRVLYLHRGRARYLGETSAAIDRFKHDQSSEETEGSPATQASETAHGSGRVILLKAMFVRPTGETIEQIRAGDPFSLILEFVCPAAANGPAIDDAVLDLTIRDGEGLLFQGTSRDYGVDFGRLPARGSMVISFETIPANSRELLFDFAILSGRTAEVYDWKRQLRLVVQSEPRLSGRLALAVHWSTRLDDAR
jgi:lipopolysaccharide transport system ATP-binding protein